MKKFLISILPILIVCGVAVASDVPWPSLYLHITNTAIAQGIDDVPPSGYVHITNWGSALNSFIGQVIVQTNSNTGAVASLDFTGLGTYAYYKVKCTDLTPSAGTPALQLLVHTDGAWQSANYQYSFFFYTAAGGSGNNGSASASAINIDSGTAGDGASIDFETDDVTTTGHSKFIRGALSGSSYGYTFQGSYQGAGNPVDGLRIQYATGNIVAGAGCTLYGMPR